MKLKTLLISLLTTVAVTTQAQTTKLVGGDLSLVPAYEAAGDVWLDADGDSINTKYKDGNSINTKYADGMITYVRDVAKWNSVRVRLLVDPTADDTRVLYNDSLATCQDIEYVKKLGKRIKDARMNFLLDIFYSDTWTDVSKQWIPDSWGYNRNTATATVAEKVKSYTTEVLNALTAYGAKPDYVQIGNEVSYGMLWDDIDSRSKNNWFITSKTYDEQQTNIKRFTTLLQAAADGVKASNASTAKIVLHCERIKDNGHAKNFYTWVEQAGFTDYDIIGLSYYPQWHGNISNLSTTLNSLEYYFPSKKIQIVETGYPHTEKGNITINTSSTWPYSPAGQAAFLTDLIAELNKHTNVDGLYYWQPEECGNGAGEVSGSKQNRVMNHWDYRGFWKLGWESGSHALDSKDALMTLMTFIGETPDESGSEGTEVTDFENLDFENGTNNIVWTVNWELGWKSNPWPTTDQWASSLTNNYIIKSYAEKASNLSAGNIIYQSKDNMPAGVYTITAVVHTDYDGIYLFANYDKISIPAVSPSKWNEAKTVSIQTTLTEPGTLTFGLTLPTKPTSTSEVNLYADNFKVTRVDTGVDNIIMDEAKTKDKPIKVLRNGMVLIEKNGRTYNAQGQIVK